MCLLLTSLDPFGVLPRVSSSPTLPTAALTRAADEHEGETAVSFHDQIG